MRSGVPMYCTCRYLLPDLTRPWVPTVPIELEGCLLHTEMSQPPERESRTVTVVQSQSQFKDYNQNLLVRYMYLVAYNVPVLFLSLSKSSSPSSQPNPAARTLRIKVGLYGHPSQNFKKKNYPKT